MNPEVDDHTIRNTVNSWVNDNFVQYCAEDFIVFNRMITNIKKVYPASVVNRFVERDFNTLIENFSDEALIEFFEIAFKGVNDLIYYRFEANTYSQHDLTGKIVLPIGYDGTRPNDVIYIGWVSDQPVDHLMEHEGLTEHNAIRMQKALNTILRKNKDVFDVFFDGNSTEEILEYIQSL